MSEHPTPQASGRECRRSFAEIDAKRKELQAKLKFHDLRSIKDRRELAMELHYSHGALICDVAFVLKIPQSTIQRWIKRPETRRAVGRPAYLESDDEEELFSRFIQERTAQQNPPSPHEVVEEVNSFDCDLT